MCPPLSCCHQRLTQPLPTQLYYLTRLLLTHAETDELLPDQHALVQQRLEQLWHRVQHAVQCRCRVSMARAIELTECLVACLLREECCRRSLRRAVSLREALGPVLD
ncbi:hypothetical protein JAO73_04950 [Hymenobacter sp. BT523]|uniref:hypothetical protein n=1 Tax=Hymenobacter sp. BT523 TaxID=2795725 RepID=UPI0018EC50DC|nr:hypothetical protein [Hymenobacter sp. BT523]MBJ6108347.1 hypothetical protein [Hymenobacter sp. BT523]